MFVGADMPHAFSATTRLVAISVAAWCALSSSPGRADPRARTIQSYLFSNPGGYDYAPSIVRDGDKWVMFTCSYNPETNSDGIYRWISTDGTNWSAPNRGHLALAIGAEGIDWDGGEVCDPTVLKNVSVLGHSWAMWYTGIKRRPSSDAGTPGSKWLNTNKIGLAYSDDGEVWHKYSGNPVIDCGDDDLSFYGCGEPSVVFSNGSYTMTHAEIVPRHYNNKKRTSSDGVTWSDGDRFCFLLDTRPGSCDNFDAPCCRDVDSDISLSNGVWYAVTQHGNGDSTAVNVLTASSASGPWSAPVGIVSQNDVRAALFPGQPIVHLTDAGFYRDPHGELPVIQSAPPQVWFAFGQSIDGVHSDSEEIAFAKLALMDAEEGATDPLLGGQSCSAPGPTVSPVQSAWTSDGPWNDDVNYWTMIADGDGLNEYCDVSLYSLASVWPAPVDFSAGSKLEISWYGQNTTGRTVSWELYFKNGTTWTFLGSRSGAQYTKYTDLFSLPASRSNVKEILFRTHESSFTNLYQTGHQARLHIYRVRLVN